MVKVFKVGDKVSVLNETIKGRIVEIEDDSIIIVDEHGFRRSYSTDQIVLHTESNYNFDDPETVAMVENKLKSIRKSKLLDNSDLSRRNYIDLHIEEIREDYRNLTNFEIVQIQMESCKTFILRALDSKHKKAYIIHGKGEGVLKDEVLAFLLKLRTEHNIQIEFHDAPYSEFGIGGATEVIFL